MHTESEAGLRGALALWPEGVVYLADSKLQIRLLLVQVGVLGGVWHDGRAHTLS